MRFLSLLCFLWLRVVVEVLEKDSEIEFVHGRVGEYEAGPFVRGELFVDRASHHFGLTGFALNFFSLLRVSTTRIFASDTP